MKPRLLLDLSVISRLDHQSGIQRVLRETIKGLTSVAAGRYSLVPIAADDDGYRILGRLEVGSVALGDGTEGRLQPRTTDLYLGLEVFLDGPISHESFFRGLNEAGAGVFFVVHDLLPLMRPDCFDDWMPESFEKWLEGVARIADGIICITETVADQLVDWLRLGAPQRPTPLRIGTVRLGSDIGLGVPEVDSQSTPDTLSIPEDRPAFLMVGTLEPRKGHQQALQAFELLWSRGIDVSLVIAGRKGWSVEELTDRLDNHPELGKRLFWMSDAEDDQLSRLYRSATALLSASEGEGFGLPVVEAAACGLPLILRDLRVFREVAGDNAFYFSGSAAGDLAGAIVEWIELNNRGAAPRSAGIRLISWHQSARQLLNLIENGDWYRVLPLVPLVPLASRPAEPSEPNGSIRGGSAVVKSAGEAAEPAPEQAGNQAHEWQLLDEAEGFLTPPIDYPSGARLLALRRLRRRLAEFLIVPQAEYNRRILSYLRRLRPDEDLPELTELRTELSTLRKEVDMLRRQLDAGVNGVRVPPAGD